MKRNNRLKIMAYIGIIITIIILSIFVTERVLAQNEFTTDISDRLKQRGVPVKYVTTIKRIPYVIEIGLKSTSNNDHLALEDNWFMILAQREATLAYRIDLGLNSFKLKVFNTRGDIIYSTQTYLYNEDINQQLSVPGEPEVDNLHAKEIINNKIKLAGLSLDRLDVVSEDIPGSYGQILIIQVSGTNIQTVNQFMPVFLDSLFRLLETINTEHGTYIVLCHLTIVDGQGNVLLDYVKDFETGSSQWTSINGLYDEWHPHTVDSGAPLLNPTPTKTPTQVAYPPPRTPYP